MADNDAIQDNRGRAFSVAWRRRTLAAVFLVLVIGAVGYFLWQGISATGPVSDAHRFERQQAAAHASHAARPATTARLASPDAASDPNDVDPQHVDPPSRGAKSVAGGAPSIFAGQDFTIRPGDARLTETATPETISWLNTNKWPSTAAQRAGTAPEVTLADLSMKDGIDPVELVAAEAIASRSPELREQALSYLQSAAMNGSIYALFQLGRYYGSQSVGQPVRAESYYAAAYLRGDWLAPTFLRMYSLNRKQQILAKMHAVQIIQELNERRARFGLPPLMMDPRPRG